MDGRKEMKYAFLIVNGLILIICITIAQAFAHQAKPIGSIKVKSNDLADFVNVSRVPLDSAVKAAVRAVPGKALKAELKNEDGSLVYKVEVIKTDKRITDVEIDAGNGMILKIQAGRKDDLAWLGSDARSAAAKKEVNGHQYRKQIFPYRYIYC